jgi:hypothetical protein
VPGRSDEVLHGIDLTHDIRKELHVIQRANDRFVRHSFRRRAFSSDLTIPKTR